MRVGAVFPQNELGSDPHLLRDYVQTVEGLGYAHLLLYDHVLGVDPSRPGGWSTAPPHGPYTHEHPFHEPLTFLAWVAAQTDALELVTGILVLPQRQTALVAKQAAEVDLLSGGRLRLGVGLGWNEVEYEALGEDFHNRGARIEAQILLLRQLWSEPVVNVHDGWHTINHAGINPLPGRRIPIWMGGMHEQVLRRAARLADGWFPQVTPSDEARSVISRLYAYLRDEGREPAAFGIEARINIGRADASRQMERAMWWRDMGAQYLSVNTMGANLAPQVHLASLRSFIEAWQGTKADG